VSYHVAFNAEKGAWEASLELAGQRVGTVTMAVHQHNPLEVPVHTSLEDDGSGCVALVMRSCSKQSTPHQSVHACTTANTRSVEDRSAMHSIKWLHELLPQVHATDLGEILRGLPPAAKPSEQAKRTPSVSAVTKLHEHTMLQSLSEAERTALLPPQDIDSLAIVRYEAEAATYYATIHPITRRPERVRMQCTGPPRRWPLASCPAEVPVLVAAERVLFSASSLTDAEEQAAMDDISTRTDSITLHVRPKGAPECPVLSAPVAAAAFETWAHLEERVRSASPQRIHSTC
jgi:hypothetical protein